MKKRLVYGSIVLMCIALAGIVSLQYGWMRHAYRLKEEQFDRQVRDALNNVAARLDKSEMQMAVISNLKLPDAGMNLKLPGTQRSMQLHAGKGATVYRHLQSIQYSDESDTSAKNVSVHSIVKLDTVLRESKTQLPAAVLALTRPPQNIRIIDTQLTVSGKRRQLGDVLDRIAVELAFSNKSITERVNKDTLLLLIRNELKARSLDTNCIVALLAGDKDTIAVQGKPDTQNLFSVRLFPNDVLSKPGYLLLGFAGKQQYILHSMFWLLGASVFFTLIVLIAFATGVFVMLRQKRLAEVKTDFINNMTHEFKTPIATISLAADALDNPQVQGNADMMHTYTAMIREENRRMNRHVEQVLQMALAEKKELELHVTPLDIEALVLPVIEKMQLQATARGGHIHFEAAAGIPLLNADEMHLRNVLFNLLDNAIKYSANTPQVRVKLFMNATHVCVEVSDNGIGMTAEQQRKIFEPFYRVPTGNLHTVKGFGLGLSYARAVTEAHKGYIEVQSQPAKGSRFTIYLPL